MKSNIGNRQVTMRMLSVVSMLYNIVNILTILYKDDNWKDCGLFTLINALNAEVVDAKEKETFDMNEKCYQYCEENSHSTIFSGGMQAYLDVGGDLKDLALSIENTRCVCGGGFFFFYGRIWW